MDAVSDLEWDVSDETPGLKEAGGDGRDGESLRLWGMSAWVMTCVSLSSTCHHSARTEVKSARSFLRAVGMAE